MFFGEAEGLTLASKWARRAELSAPRDGEQTLSFPCDEAPARARVLVQHAGGQFWSTATISAAGK